ncbi:hypothetical protein NE237_022954 [Protea cynaroides]|uniref:Uncharacterized protein n=1 Tax=Protea cynaroides TaxID=273540 RepID=A0A9Q0HBZ1_9MAGN|nr:hypothetical protein NE237_022954 [Protea cynaroides]
MGLSKLLQTPPPLTENISTLRRLWSPSLWSVLWPWMTALNNLSANKPLHQIRPLCLLYHLSHLRRLLPPLASASDDEDDDPTSPLPLDPPAEAPPAEPTTPLDAPITFEISYNALAGHSSPTTLRFNASIQGSPVQVLVDSGSTHNFVQSRIA